MKQMGCYKCTERFPRCHSNCEKYQAYLLELNNIKENIKNEKNCNRKRKYLK